MAARSTSPPKYRHYKPKDLGVVRLDGRDFYLRKYGTPESWEKYHRLVAEWMKSKRTRSSAIVKEGPPSVATVIRAF